MHVLTIRDYLKCAHSLTGEVFGPAQLLHVNHYEVDVSFETETLDAHGIIVDFGLAQSGLSEIVGSMNFKNLDTLPFLRGKNTTTEFLCTYIHGEIHRRVQAAFQGRIRVTLKESPVAWTSYTK